MDEVVTELEVLRRLFKASGHSGGYYSSYSSQGRWVLVPAMVGVWARAMERRSSEQPADHSVLCIDRFVLKAS